MEADDLVSLLYYPPPEPLLWHFAFVAVIDCISHGPDRIPVERYSRVVDCIAYKGIGRRCGCHWQIGGWVGDLMVM